MTRLVITLAVLLASATVRAEDAAALYQAKCKVCHGADGKGTSMGLKMGAKDFGESNKSEAEIAKVIADGSGKMTGFKGKISDDQIQALAKYVHNGLR